jgi:hypothetical protein
MRVTCCNAETIVKDQELYRENVLGVYQLTLAKGLSIMSPARMEDGGILSPLCPPPAGPPTSASVGSHPCLRATYAAKLWTIPGEACHPQQS